MHSESGPRRRRVEDQGDGQLVAAELILSGVFYGIAQLGWYLDTFYDLVASSEELSQIFAIPQEALDLNGQAPPDGSVRFRNVELASSRFNFSIESGEQTVMLAEPGVERQIALLLKRHVNPDTGLLTIGGSDLGSFDMYLLRSAVVVLNRPSIVDVTIREYLNMAAGGDADSAVIIKVLDIVGLTTRISSLPKGLDTQLASSGSPLSILEVMQLKAATALISRPKVLLLSQLYDMMPDGPLQATLRMLREQGTTVLLFTGRPEAVHLDSCYWLGATTQHRFTDTAALSRFLVEKEAQA